MNLRVFEAFAGIGTQRMALKRAGIPHEVVAISEIDRHAIKAYTAIHGDTTNMGDIREITSGDVPDHDLFTYSFPCQDISIAGKKRGFTAGSGTRSSLLWECERIISDKRPKYLLLENVKALVNRHNRPGFEEWLAVLEGYGYTNYWKVLNAKNYGVPQNRERVFCVSIHGEHKPFEFPEPVPLTVRAIDLLEDEVDERYYLSEKIARRFTLTPRLETEIKIYGHVKTRLDTSGYRYLVYDPRGIMTCLTGTEAKFPKLLAIGASRGRNPADPSDRTAGMPTVQRIEINRDGVSNTLSTVQKDNLVVESAHRIRIRHITPREAWRLMGISDQDYDKASTVASKTQLYKMAGNAIAVPVLEALFTQMLTDTAMEQNQQKDDTK